MAGRPWGPSSTPHFSPPYGWPSHGVNSQITVFPVDTASRASRSKARRQKPESCCLEQVRTDLLPCSVWPPRTSAIGRCPACSVSVRYGAVLFPRAKVPPPLKQKWTPLTSTDRSVPCQLTRCVCAPSKWTV